MRYKDYATPSWRKGLHKSTKQQGKDKDQHNKKSLSQIVHTTWRKPRQKCASPLTRCLKDMNSLNQYHKRFRKEQMNYAVRIDKIISLSLKTAKEMSKVFYCQRPKWSCMAHLVKQKSRAESLAICSRKESDRVRGSRTMVLWSHCRIVIENDTEIMLAVQCTYRSEQLGGKT